MVAVAATGASVRGAMTEPEELLRDLERMTELKRADRRGDPRKEAKVWLNELAKLERMRDGYHDQAAEGLLGFDEMRGKPTALGERRANAERELEALRGQGEELERLERHWDAVVSHYAALAPEVLECLGPKKWRRLYGLLGPKVFVEDDEAWADMPIRPPTTLEGDGGYRNEVMSTSGHTDARSSIVWHPAALIHAALIKAVLRAGRLIRLFREDEAGRRRCGPAAGITWFVTYPGLA